MYVNQFFKHGLLQPKSMNNLTELNVNFRNENRMVEKRIISFLPHHDTYSFLNITLLNYSA